MPISAEAQFTRADGADSGGEGAGARIGGVVSRLPWSGRRDLRPHRLRSLWSSTLGKKYVVAITGTIFAVWVVLHMLGNLKEIEGPGGGRAAIDGYTRFLRTVGSPVAPHDLVLWIVRIILIAALILHVTAVTQLWRRNRRAKAGHLHTKRQRSTIAARTMTLSGGLILAFLVFHILHFTLRTIHPTPLTHGHVYANVYDAFRLWWLDVIYIGAVGLLGLHMFHGLWSAAQTSGVDNPDRNWFWRRLATAVTALTVVGFALVPVLVATGSLPAPVNPSRVAHR